MFGVIENAVIYGNEMFCFDKIDMLAKNYVKERISFYKQQRNAPVTQAVSGADEIKKYKELLDMGIITQEEFDKKKQQILGF